MPNHTVPLSPKIHNSILILSTPGTQLTWDDFDHDAEVKVCPRCNYVMRFWYVTAYDRDGDYLDSLTCYRCLRCDHTIWDDDMGGEQ